MNNKKSLEQFKKNINLMFENNDKKIYLHKDDALKIEYYIYSLEQQVKKQKEVIDKAIEKINDYKIYCKENKGFTEYTDIEIEAIEPVISKLEDILNEVSE